MMLGCRGAQGAAARPYTSAQEVLVRTPAWSLALGAVLIVGCNEQPTSSTDLDAAAVAPAFAIDHAPAQSGIVMRGETSVGVGWTDEEDGTFVFIGIDPRDFCNGTFEVDFVPTHEAALPGDRGTLELAQGQDLRTTVWPFPGFSGCDLLEIYEPLASGVSDLVYTDNFGFRAGRSNANTFGYRAHGTLVLANGADAAFSAHWNRTYNGNTGVKDNTQISLH